MVTPSYFSSLHDNNNIAVESASSVKSHTPVGSQTKANVSETSLRSSSCSSSSRTSSTSSSSPPSLHHPLRRPPRRHCHTPENVTE